MAIRVSAPVRAPAEVMVEDHLVPTGTVGIDLHLRNKRSVDHQHFTSERTIVLMHGATFPSASLFDVAFDGISFMDALAQAGLDVWSVDVRGYGGSTRPPEMDAPPEDNDPLTPATTAIADLSAAIDFVCRHRGIVRINLLGHSWGGSIAGAYASTNTQRVTKLVLAAPLWLSATPLRIDPGTQLGAYRFADVRAYEVAWRIQAPESKRADLIPAGWFREWADATLATDPASPHLGAIRAPNGAIKDVRTYWRANRKLYEPSFISCPVLLLRGEWDVDVHFEMATSLFAELTGAPYRRRIEIGEATHMLLSEKNRWQVYDAAIVFIKESFVPEAD